MTTDRAPENRSNDGPLTATIGEQMQASEDAAAEAAADDDAPLTATIAEEVEAGEEPTASPDPEAVAEQESHIEAKAASGDVAVLAHGTVTMDPPNEAGEAVSSAGSETATESSVKE